MNRLPVVAVVGASGFVGHAVVDALTRHGVRVVPVKAPRLRPRENDAEDGHPQVSALAHLLRGSETVIGCAGLATAIARGEDLVVANGTLPGVIGAAAKAAGITRYVHVSSAAVQGSRPILDDSAEVSPFSPYARSKILGEDQALAHGPPVTVVYRPPSVHGPNREQTRRLVRLARSRLSSVASPGDDPTPVAHIDTVGEALAHLALTPRTPPRVVIHPWEGVTTGALLALVGGREARRVPRPVAAATIRHLNQLARVRPAASAHVRRLEILWFGQGQAESWLTADGFAVPPDVQRWRDLAAAF